MEGELEYNYQKDAAKDAAKNLNGVIGVSNNITIKSTTEEKVEKADIESAFKGNWQFTITILTLKFLAIISLG